MLLFLFYFLRFFLFTGFFLYFSCFLGNTMEFFFLRSRRSCKWRMNCILLPPNDTFYGESCCWDASLEVFVVKIEGDLMAIGYKKAHLTVHLPLKTAPGKNSKLNEDFTQFKFKKWSKKSKPECPKTITNAITLETTTMWFYYYFEWMCLCPGMEGDVR